MAAERRTIFGLNVLSVPAMLLTALVHSTVYGADAPITRQRPANPPGKASQGTPAMTTTPVPARPAEKKTIVINPALIDAVYQALLMTDATAEMKEFDEALKEAKNIINSESHRLWYYQNYAKQCAKKAYTTEDQKKAGCLGGDTLDQCSKKLFNACFSHQKNHSFFKWREQMLNATDRLDKAQKAYMNKLKMVPKPK